MISQGHNVANHPSDFSLKLKDDELAFFKSETGIHDETELYTHIEQIQEEAYAVFPYTCIRQYSFTTLKISKHPQYEDLIKFGKENLDAILLDLGCCFGNDVRKAVSDGYPLKNIIASDLRAEFWALGHKLFKSSPETFPVHFIPGDIFDPAFLSPTPSSERAKYTLTPLPPSLSTLTSLSPLQSHISFIHIASVFHLFSESQQQRLTHLLGSLLSPRSGSMVLGSQMGLPDTEANKAGKIMFIASRQTSTFVHSPTSFSELWIGEGGVFSPNEAITRASISEERVYFQTNNEPTHKSYRLVWSVTRV